MTDINQELKPFFESALKTLECIIEHKDELSKMDPRKEPYYGIFETFDQKICIFNGLCDNISAAFEADLESYTGNPLIAPFFNISNSWISKWPKYSGQSGYPVPMPDNFPLDWGDYSEPDLGMDEQPEHTKAYAAFQSCDNVGYNMFSGEYGQLRIELAEYWAGKLKEKLNEIN